MTQRSAGIRARVRAELIDEIKVVARRHLAAEGANLSLRAVARDMGMVSSALYRYFASRDELLTALIIDGYNAMGEVAEVADAAITDRADVVGRWLAVARALREWALAQPHEYALLYGSPVPGYAAPGDTVGPAGRPTIVLGGILADAARHDPDAAHPEPGTAHHDPDAAHHQPSTTHPELSTAHHDSDAAHPEPSTAHHESSTAQDDPGTARCESDAMRAERGITRSGRGAVGRSGATARSGPDGGSGEPADPPLPPALRAEVRRITEAVAPGAGIDDTVIARALIAWTELFGAISFELFGRLNNTIDHRAEWFDHQMRVMAAFIGLR